MTLNISYVCIPIKSGSNSQDQNINLSECLLYIG